MSSDAIEHPTQVPPPDPLTGSPELLAALVQHALDAILVLDSHLCIRLWNPAAEAMFGYPAGALLGKPMDPLLPGGIARSHEESIRKFGERPIQGRRMGGRRRLTHGVRASGEQFPIETALSFFESGGERFYMAIIRDITEQVRAEEQLRYQSTHDSLTGLYNRMFFEEELARLERGRKGGIAIVIADVDGLKPVNDQYGHAAGDALIIAAAHALRSAFRAEDVVARLGGDEFGLLLSGTTPNVIEKAVERARQAFVRANLSQPVHVTSLSVGYAVSRPGESLSDAMVRADEAMYDEKRRNKSED